MQNKLVGGRARLPSMDQPKVDQSIILDRKPADMVQYMVEENKLTQVPPEFIKPPQERRKTATVEAGKLIPVIDMALLADAQGKEKVMAEAVRACEEWGFLQVINHGVSETLMDAAMEMTKRFFALPSAEKEEFKIRAVGGLGYGRFFEYPGGTKDWVDRLVVCAVHKDVREPYDLVVTNPTDFQAVLEEYGDAVHKLAKEILSIFSEGMGQSSHLFSSQFAGLEFVAVQTGLNFYPPCPQPELVMGASGHADVSVVTILQQGEVSGLEVLRESCWVPVPPIKHAFVVNVGDILQIVSNDRLKSLTHRAIAGPIGRFSIANFLLPWRDVLVQPIAELCNNAQVPAFMSVEYGDYFYVNQNDVNATGVERLRVK